MRLLMTADTVGGVWTYAIELCRGLSLQGVEIALATMGERLNRGQQREAQTVRHLEVFESDFKLEWMDNPWDDVDAAGDWLLEIEKIFQPDIVHLNGYAHGSLRWRVPNIVACHSCVLSWSKAVYGRREARNAGWEYRERVQRGLKAADHLVAPSLTMLRDIFEIYDCSDCSASVISNGRSAAQFFPGTKKPYVLSAGRIWDCGKNIGGLSRISGLIEWPIFVAGSGKVLDSEMGRCQQLGQLNSTEMSYWLSEAAIYCLPAKYEPFGLSVLEAALCGCALVLGDIPSLREIWDGAAIFVNPNDDAHLASALNALIGDEAWRQRIARHARERAVLFSPRRMTDEYLAVYKGVKDSRLNVRAKEARCAS
jgi:glycogen synthase